MQTRKMINDIHGERKFEIVCGSNVGNPEWEIVLAIGEQLGDNAVRWIHLPRAEILKIILEHENRVELERIRNEPVVELPEKPIMSQKEIKDARWKK